MTDIHIHHVSIISSVLLVYVSVGTVFVDSNKYHVLTVHLFVSFSVTIVIFLEFRLLSHFSVHSRYTVATQYIHALGFWFLFFCSCCSSYIFTLSGQAPISYTIKQHGY